MALSGLINALVRIRPADLVSTDYGRLILAKVVALAALGVLGWQQRRRGVAALRQDPDARGPLVRFALVEAVIFGLTFGVAVALGRTPPPPPLNLNLSIPEVELGYDLAGPPTLSRILFDWRFDLVFGTAAIIFALVYIAGVIRLRRRGDAWPAGRTAAWLLGCLVLLLATSSGIGRYMPAMFSTHMVAHMMLSMLAPILLVLGAPVTLALRALPASGRNDPPGPREWLLAALHSRFSQVLTNPFVATALFIVGFYGLYFGGIFDAVAGSHFAHLAMNLHFLLSGYLFYWVVIGIDPTPRPLPPLAKLAMVFASLPLHAFFGVVLMSTQSVIAESFYRSLNLSWHTDLLGDQKLGGGIAWAAGEVPLVVVLIALFVQWRRSDERTAKRLDRAADRDDDADLAAYNAMLAEFTRRERERG
jgi:putative copper resistance protein D